MCVEFPMYFEQELNVCICKKCNRKYRQMLEEQTPGFRIKDEDICPYCGFVNGTSMEYEFYNEKMENE